MTMDIEQRIAMLVCRTTREAWARLQQMRHHSRFEELMTDLERLSGAVTDRDVVSAARRIIDPND